MTYISTLPTPPSRSDDPTGFSNKADALLAALPDFVTEANALSDEVDGMRDDAESKRAATETLRDETTALKDAAEDARDAALSYKDTANTYRGQAETARDQAQTAAAAAGAAAGLPSLTGNAKKFLRVAESEGGVEFAATGQTQTITSSTTWTKPSAAVFLLELWGAGGGGANAVASSNVCCSGAEGGEYAYKIIDSADMPDSVEVVIGAGGGGAANGTSAVGTNGGNTSFGSILTARGGFRGYYNSTTTANIIVPIGGYTTTVAQDSLTLERVWLIGATAGRGGYPLSAAQYNAGQSVLAGGGGGGGAHPSNGAEGAGGISRNGGNGGAASRAANTKAGDGSFPSGGGGSSIANGGGGNGANGMARITWW